MAPRLKPAIPAAEAIDMRNALRRMAQRRSCPQRNRRTDEGFSLVEVVVSLGIVSVVFLALAAATLTGVKGTLVARQNQQALDAVNQAIEGVRSLEYAATTMVTSDLSGDSAITRSGGVYVYNPGTGAEPIVSANVGSINPHVSTVYGTNGTKYTVSRYITAPLDATGAQYRRLTVVASWRYGGDLRSRKASTFLVETRRGLPLPRFSYAGNPTTSQTKGPGTVLNWGFKLQNLGARDAWNIVADRFSWRFYLDTNHDGVHDSTENTQLADFDGNGTPDTGALDNLEVYWFVAERTIGTTESGTSMTRFTATSVAQPAASTAVKFVDETLNVSSGVINTPSPTVTTTTIAPSASASASATASASASASATATASTSTIPAVTGSPNPAPVASCTRNCTLTAYYLRNTGIGNTVTASRDTMDTSTTAGHTSAYNYSTDKTGNSGRYLQTGGTGAAESDKYKVAYWRTQLGAKGTYAGTAKVTVYVGCLTSNGPVTLTAYLGGESAGIFSSSGTGSATLTYCSTTSFTPLTISVPATFSVAKNDWLGLKLEASGGTDVRLLYDYTGYMANVVVPA
jgi:type II secretory pathway pseudopilin PulG